ncbi:hypothetical protein CRE_03851 [Caenorhabditis remanei]|uniref:Uncharacterized protein n=1 Tax=Caenorhabditis remanei TaxID=31234 RepID=E3LXH1_CAERE|nr:hypothetical protein CRE_03851 [Caenorhabditis remanei]
MSKSQIKRLHQQQELEKSVNLEDEDDNPVPVQRKGPANRFAFFDDEGEEETGSQSDEVNEEGTEPSSSAQKNNKKKAKKNKKKVKKGTDEPEETENQMLARLAAMNVKEAKKAGAEGNTSSLEELMKIDMKLFDTSAEVKRKLGKAFKEVALPGQPEEHSWPQGKRATGRIIKNKPRWFPDRPYGVSMVQKQKEGDNTWFALKHNTFYEQRERMFWMAEDAMNVGIIQEIFSDAPYHLNSVLMLAHVNRMSEDLNQAADMIERGIWYVDQHAAPTFEPFNWRHRMDYTDYENRVFYLLLHRHMLNAAHKRCWETALNTGKLIFKLDPVRDPLAMMSIIDVFALKAKQYTWILDVFEAAKKFKKLHLLPNWPYSVALAKYFVAKTDEDKEQAESELCTAIRHFPSVVVAIMDLLQIHPDSAVMNCKMLTSFTADNEHDSLKLLVKIYTKQTEEIWKVPETLLFLEGATRKVATSNDSKDREECDEWKEKRFKMYHGRSPNVDRLGELLEVIPSTSISDPVPPKNGRCGYPKNGQTARVLADNSFLGGLLHSLLPHFDGENSFQEQLNRYGSDFLQFIMNQFNGPENGDPEQVAARWMEHREGLEPRGAGDVIQFQIEEPFELPRIPGERRDDPEEQNDNDRENN